MNELGHSSFAIFFSAFAVLERIWQGIFCYCLNGVSELLECQALTTEFSLVCADFKKKIKVQYSRLVR